MFIVGGSLLLILVVIACIYPLTQKKESQNFAENSTDISVEAKVDEYQSLEAIENNVEIIVKVEKTSEEEPIIWRNEHGSVYFVGTIGNVKITEIYKNESDRQLETGDTIPVFENEAYDSKENVTYHVADYKKMSEGKEYILFLNYSDGDQWYVLCSAVWGKYPLDNSEPILYKGDDSRAVMDSSYDLIDQIGLEVIDKYH